MIDLTAKLVAAYVKSNPVAASEVPDLIRSTYSALAATTSLTSGLGEQQQPFVSVKKSITPDAIVCLECGKGQQMLKRHLTTAHGLSVAEYRAKWSLAADYPMVAPNYSERRSNWRSTAGWGGRRRWAAERQRL